jgi:hypothetical protein
VHGRALRSSRLYENVPSEIAELAGNPRERKAPQRGVITSVAQVPAITRSSARIDDLGSEGYKFNAEDTGRDYCIAFFR